jgi:hypothetical protein
VRSDPPREPRAREDALAPAWTLAPAAAAIASHATALTAGFVWLDHAHIEAGYALASPSGWPALFTRGFAGTGFYRPLMALSLSIDALAGAPWLYHAVSVAWHAAAATLVVFAASALGWARRAAILGLARLELDDLAGARQAFADASGATSDPEMRRRLAHNLAGVALRGGDPAECWRLLEPEVARDDALPESIYLAAKALHALRREDDTRALIVRLKRMGWTGQPAQERSARGPIPRSPAGP